jgi:hypothetical protein
MTSFMIVKSNSLGNRYLHMPRNYSTSTEGPLNPRLSLWLSRNATDGDSIRGKLSLNRSDYAIDSILIDLLSVGIL